jgi:hypothetical protein
LGRGVAAGALLVCASLILLYAFHRLRGGADAELVGWCVALGVALAAAAAFLAESVFDPANAAPTVPLRFVVLRHEGHGPLHFDLMLETSPGSPLATWRCPEWPIAHGATLQQLADHRAIYLDYEGPISGDRGTVVRIAQGHYTYKDAPAGGKQIDWNTTGVPGVILRRVDRDRWQVEIQ